MPGVKAPCASGTVRRAFTFGHVRQLAAAVLVAWCAQVDLLGGQPHRDAVTWLDVDDTMRETHGNAKQGVGYGSNKVDALVPMVSTAGPTSTTRTH